MRTALRLAPILLALTSACAASHMIERPDKPPIVAQPGRATLLIIRPTSFGYTDTFDDFLDGKLIGQTRGRCYFAADVPLGLHYVLGQGENLAVARIDFQPGRLYALAQGVFPGVFKAHTGFWPMTAGDARREMADDSCDFRVYDVKHPGADMPAADYRAAVADYEIEVVQDPSRHADTAGYKGFERL